MTIKSLIKKRDVLKTDKFKVFLLYLFTVESIILLAIGIYYLVKDNSIIMPAVIIFVIAYLIGAIRSIISKRNLQKQTKSIKKKIIIGVLMFVACMALSFFREQILGSYFIGQQITTLTIWFLIGVVLENVVVLIIFLRKEKRTR